MSLPLPASDGVQAIAPGPVVFQIVNGSITGGAQLYDVASLQPAGLYYKAAAYDNAGFLRFSGNFAVTGASFNMGAAVPTSITTTNISYLSPIFANGNNTLTGNNTFTGTNTFNTLNAQILNGIVNAALFSGVDIGAQTNNAILSLPPTPGGAHCGEVYIPSGNYVSTTTIIKPRCVKLAGGGAINTNILWNGSSTGAVIVAEDSVLSGAFPEGAIEDLTLTGLNSNATGIYFGGDPTNTLSPSTSYGNHQNVNRLRINGFTNGISFGNNTWSITIFESVIYANSTAINVIASSTNSGESITIESSSVNNNTSYAIFVPSANFCPAYCFNLAHDSFDFNGNGTTAPIQTGFTSVASYFIASNGPLFDTTNAGGWVNDFGSTWTTGTTSYFGKLTAFYNNVFAGSIFNETGTANTDLFNGNGFSNLIGIQTLGNTVSLRGIGTVTTVGPFGSQGNHAFASCEAGSAPTVLSTGGLTTNTGQNCLPAGAVIDAIVYRITTTITTAANFTIGDSGSAARYCGTQSTLAAGTTGTCTAQGYYINASALPVKITTNANPGAGAIRLIVYYHTWTPPTS